MTAATDPATLAQAGGQPSQGARQAPRSGPPEGRPDRAAGAVRDAPAATRATVAQSARTAVPAPRRPSPVAVISDGSATSSRAISATVSAQAGAAARDAGRSTSGGRPPGPATLAEGGSKIGAGRADLGPRGDVGGTRSGHGDPASATLVGDGPDSPAVAYADGLDGAERKVLLHHIAQAFPDVVEAGAELVAQWRAECAERRRKNGRRHEHDRRRRRAAEAGGGGNGGS